MLKQLLTQLSFTKEGQLIRAALDGNTERVHQLIQSGVDPNTQTKNGYTPLMGAAMEGNMSVVRLFLQAGADLELKDFKSGQTALFFATDQNRAEIMKLLIKAGADLEATDIIGEYTPLFYSVIKGHVAATQVLLDAGANPYAIGNEGESVLELAEGIDNQQINTLFYSTTKSSNLDKPEKLNDFDYLKRLISEKKMSVMIADDTPMNVDYDLFTFQKLFSKKRLFLQLNETGSKVEYPTPWETILDKYEYLELDKLAGKKSDSIDKIENASGNFGYEWTNPIPANDAVGERSYIEALECRCGSHFLYKRSGSVGQGLDGHTLDLYQLVCFKANCKISLYFDMYHGTESKLLPTGLRRSNQKKGLSVEEFLQHYPEKQNFIKQIFG